ncbi:MAG: hypothetical protein RL134_1558 [Actinomycetota bacterium]|jgi:murein DD-endopeptidase MepM/ murein hydrolase activator NlpD
MTLLAVTATLLTTVLGALPGAPATEPPWVPPVRPLVVDRPFLPPAGPYAAGHRGVDLAAEPGTIVRAPAPGIVRVAEQVAGTDVVSIEHPHRILGRTGWRTTYVGVRASVEVGDAVAAGDSLGVVVVHEHSAGIHWGLKAGRTYADPLLLLRRSVVLKPLGPYARGCACSYVLRRRSTDTCV